jgi:hypothetical protein
MMNKTLLLALIAACVLSGCKSSAPSASTASSASSGPAANPGDPVEMKLAELAGGGASNCGHLKSQAADQMDSASKCAMQSAQQKHPFFVAYDLPGMTVAVAGNSEGKLFSVQTQTGGAGLTNGACPDQLRIAPSGRVTCYAPGTFPMGDGAGSHSNMTMPPAMGANPHQGAGGPPSGQPNSHQPQDQKPPAKL